MSGKNNSTLIIAGSGIAGISAAISARQTYPHADIIIMSGDKKGFYNRIALNSIVIGKKSIEELYFNKQSWLADNRIEFIYSEIKNINPENHKLVTHDSKEYKYDKLILATGASPLLPPVDGIDNDKVYPLWTLQDAVNLKDALSTCESVLIIGGGVLGVEAALDFAKSGKQVTIIEKSNNLMPSQLTDESSKLLLKMLAQKNISVLTNSTVESIIKNGSSVKVKIKNKDSVTFDIVTVVTGVTPNIQIAKNAGININRGIITDKYMATSAPDIFACGNCTEFENNLNLLWNPAMEQGICAGQNIFQLQKEYVRKKYSVHLKNLEISLSAIGNPLDINENDRIININNTDGRKSIKTLAISNDGIIKYAAFINDTEFFYQIEKAVKNRLEIPVDIIKQNSLNAVIEYVNKIYEKNSSGWVCQMCGYTHEGDNPPDICCVCGVGKDQFLVT